MQELDFVESTDQLDSLENFVNTGMNLTQIKNIRNEKSVNDKDFPLPQRVHTNEQVSLLFTKKIKKDSTVHKVSNNLIGKPYVREYEGIFYRTYSFIDLLNLSQIKHFLKKGEEIFINEQTMLSVYEGHTIFSIFFYNPQVLE